jgi:hypothetical protein
MVSPKAAVDARTGEKTCPESVPPLADLGFAGASFLAAGGLAFANAVHDAMCDQASCKRSDKPWIGAVVVGGVFLASGIYGLSANAHCRADLHAEPPKPLDEALLRAGPAASVAEHPAPPSAAGTPPVLPSEPMAR